MMRGIVLVALALAGFVAAEAPLSFQFPNDIIGMGIIASTNCGLDNPQSDYQMTKASANTCSEACNEAFGTKCQETDQYTLDTEVKTCKCLNPDMTVSSTLNFSIPPGCYGTYHPSMMKFNSKNYEGEYGCEVPVPCGFYKQCVCGL
eukprot:GHVO01023706.1.p1 GENE.GHVO01023706.1~~GHVO01023706.1.p1  ORF type:complete len:147 (+),score=19.20 GHVO01023706.1:270-710(+)